MGAYHRSWSIIAPISALVMLGLGCSSTPPQALIEPTTTSPTVDPTDDGDASITPDTAAEARPIPTEVSAQTNHWLESGTMTDQRIELVWSEVEGDDVVYQIFRFDGIGFDPSPLDLSEPIHEATDTLRWVDESVEAGSFFTYVLRVIADDTVLERRWTTALAVTDTTPPTTITDLTATVTAEGVLLEWSPSEDDVEFGSYAVYRIEGTDGARYLGGGGDRELTSFIDDEIPASGELRYQVSASDFHGNRSAPVDILVTVG